MAVITKLISAQYHPRRVALKCHASTLTFILYLLATVPLYATVTTEKTPNDVYYQVQQLAEDVRVLRRENGITSPWPQVKFEGGREPRHVFQKALEVLEKINNYRLNIAKTGGITVPRFPGRDITPNEVYSVVLRLRQELAPLVQEKQQKRLTRRKKQNRMYTPSHVYAALSEVSFALEETLGLRGITPSEVYTRSIKIIELVKFLRRSQSNLSNISEPDRGQGKLPNHALKSVHALMQKIHRAEQNLWMKPLKLPKLPRRVITPSDVYDAMGVAMAELQRIQFRLGLEREFAEPPVQKGKTPDDVIQNTVWATALLPQFELGKPLQQYDRSSLIKTPNQVFAITEHILRQLKQYRRLQGIQNPIHKIQVIPGLKPRHVYGKTLEIMEKVNLLRQRHNMGSIAVPRYPLRTITPTEVFDLTLRLDGELILLYGISEMDLKPWLTSLSEDEYEGKQPSDVFLNMQRISNLLDSLLGSEGYTPNDVYREVLAIKQDVQVMAQSLGNRIPAKLWKTPKFEPGTEPRDVLAYAKNLLDLIVMAKKRAGMFGVPNIAITPRAAVTPSDVFNQVRLINTELTKLKVFLGVSSISERPAIQARKTPAHVLQVMEGIAAALRHIQNLDANAEAEDP